MHRKLTFTIADGPLYWRTHRVMELCEYLTANVLEPMFRRENLRWDGRFLNFFTYDNGCDPLDPTGTIRFEVPPLFSGRIGELEKAITTELAKLKIKIAPFTYEKDPAIGKVNVISIKITDNPTALCAPPDVNMSQTRGCLVLRDLLGFDRVNGRYEFAAEDLVTRVSAITEDRIAACTASPVKNPDGLRRIPSPMSMKAIRRCLEEIRQFGNWALTHNHRRLAAV